MTGPFSSLFALLTGAFHLHGALVLFLSLPLILALDFPQSFFLAPRGELHHPVGCNALEGVLLTHPGCHPEAKGLML